MLKKVLKMIGKLETRAKKSDVGQLAVGTSLSTKIRNAIADLEGRAKEHDAVAAAARQAAQRLRDQLHIDTPTKPVSKPATPPAVKKPAPAGKKPTPKAKPVQKAAPVKKTTATPKAVTKAPTKPTTKSKAHPTLAQAIRHVLETRRKANAGGVKARQLHAEVQQAGYRFGGDNTENQMNYLNKTLRQNSAQFKRAGDGLVALA
jgi:outer membrane biosynthesis protein TonB